MNIELPILKSTYFGIYNTEEEYNQDLENRKEELNEAFFGVIINNDTSAPDKYQYSTRTTNNDNEILGSYNNNDSLVQASFYPTVFGVLGWMNTVVEYEEKQLEGGYFTNYVTTYEIPYAIDTWKLKNIDYFLYYLPEVNKIAEIDLSNVVTANYAFGKSTLREIYIDGIEKLTNFSNLKQAQYFLCYWHATEINNYNIIYNMPNLTDAYRFYYNFNCNTNKFNIKLNAPNIILNNIFYNTYIGINTFEIDILSLLFSTKLKTNYIEGLFYSSAFYEYEENNINDLTPITIVYDFDKWFDLEENSTININNFNYRLQLFYKRGDSVNINTIPVNIKIISTKYKIDGDISLGIYRKCINNIIIDDVTKNNLLNITYLNSYTAVGEGSIVSYDFNLDEPFDISNILPDNYVLKDNEFHNVTINASGTVNVANSLITPLNCLHGVLMYGNLKFTGLEYIDYLYVTYFKNNNYSLYFEKIWDENIIYNSILDNFPNYRKCRFNYAQIEYINQPIIKVWTDKTVFENCNNLDFTEHPCEIHVVNDGVTDLEIFDTCNNLKSCNIFIDSKFSGNDTYGRNIIQNCNNLQDINITLADDIIESTWNYNIISIYLKNHTGDINNFVINYNNNYYSTKYSYVKVKLHLDSINSIKASDLLNIKINKDNELTISSIAYNKFTDNEKIQLANIFKIIIIEK